ncbi:mechanosensitive ion channel domain-containing protein [Marivita sp. XM-24bin2]|jgi:small-conductance mechanosensitive channel|uniref:mechanosensitive ion channel family protein n=1 Tax=unclassified Marivita TaxID=2632480 RepID=UPI000D7B62FF|nr:mechanosensitive ion channel domain-containing protein [Marivita sp. XM-24bin2]MCR9109187.1 mechanosensitive ion channel [Paracoccaceae bacterium]PWL34751.1 MAG: mechanosensitive ion channel protein [Marivita sp. XM-24bin2]
MDPEVVSPEALTQISRDVFLWAQSFLESLVRPWNAYQLGIALAVFVIAHVLAALIKPRMHEWMRGLEGWPKWRIRALLVFHRRLRMVLFVLLIWFVVFVMRETTWPSRSYLLEIIADLSTAWLLIAFATRLIRNALMRSIVRYGAWIWVTLSITGLADEAQTLLDSAAFTIGETRLSVWLLVQAIVIVAALLTLARLVAGTTAATIRKNDDISPAMQVLAIKFLQVLLFGTAFFLGLRIVGVDLTGLAVLSGAIGVGLGFGLQKVVSNLVSGIIILLDKSIKPGDVISLGDTFGWISSLGARYVSVVTRDGKEYLIPNEDLITGQVVNWSHSNEFVRLDIYFGTAYGDDPHKVREIAINAAKSVDRVLSFKAPVCHIVGFGDSSVDYILRFWIRDPTGGLTNIRGNVYLALWDAFQEHGVSIPFPQREVKVLEGSQLATHPHPE